MVAASADLTLIARLIDAAERAAAAGRHAEAARLLADAGATAPGHPRVLGALGMHALRTGDVHAGRTHLTRAVEADPGSPLPWFHLALACRAAGDPAAEMQALDRALALDARLYVAHLQKGLLLERQGRPKAAARCFTAFLNCLPPPAQQPPPLQQAAERARAAVAADRAALDHHLQTHLAAARAALGAPQPRFEHCIDVLLGRRRIFTPQPTFMHFPRLPAIEFYDRAEFPWLTALEAAGDAMREELAQALAAGAAEFVPYVDYPEGLPLEQWRELNRSRQWSAYYLFKNGRRLDDHCARCPRTAALLDAAPLADVPGEAPTAFFSLLQPGTRIPPHTGVTNTRLVVHVPLVVPPGCGFRVGSETREWQPGHAWVFDDTIEHEAWNGSDAPRIILIVDIWNPYLTAAERSLVSAATVAAAEYARD